MNIRESVLDELAMLSQPSKQLDYDCSLTVAGHAPSELICGFCDDVYHPKDPQFIDAFSADELKELAHLYGLISEAFTTDFSTVLEMLKNPKWRRVVSFAKDLMPRLQSASRPSHG